MFECRVEDMSRGRKQLTDLHLVQITELTNRNIPNPILFLVFEGYL